MGASPAVARVSRVVRAVVAAAVDEARATGVVVQQDWSPEGELLYEWLVHELGEARVWRGASLTDNVQGEPAARARAAAALVAHPTNKTALLLGGRPPYADLLPLGDLWASQVEEIAGRWSAPHEVEALATRMGGIRVLDVALQDLVERRGSVEGAEVDADAAAEIGRLYARGRFFRLRPRLVPKLTIRTVGIDLFD